MQENNEQLIALGNHIKKLRQNQKLSVASLCYKNGLEHSTVGRIEKGKVDPKYLTLVKLADALGVEIAELLGF